MNFGIILLGLMLVGASIFGVILIGADSQQTYTDSFGAVQGNTSNSTQAMVTNTTAPMMEAAAGLGFVIAIILVFVAAIFLMGSMRSHGGRR